MERNALPRLFRLTILLTIALTLSFGAQAATVPITSYDIQQTPGSGFGCWYHNYTGVKTDTGRTVSGSVICTPEGGHVYDYSNGSGTLNDGLFDTTHLLLTRNDDIGVPLQPVITLHLDNFYTINEIRLLQGSSSFTNITGVTVQIGGTAIPITPVPIGIGTNPGLSVMLDLRGTALAGIPTNQIALKDFSAIFTFSDNQGVVYKYPIDQFGIGEVEVDGTAVVLSPTSIDQCLNGGWKKFGFKNEGLCIKSVVQPDR